MADEAAVTQAVDAVEEAVPAADLEEWAGQEEAPVKAEAKPAAKSAAPAPKKGADAIAEKGGRPEKPAPKVEAKPKPALPYDPNAKVKITIDGEEEEITIDEALRRARKASASDRRFQEAARLRQEAEPLRALEQFKGLFSDEDVSRAKAVLRERNLDPNDPRALRAMLGEMVVIEQIEREKLEKENPSELRRREAEAKLREMEAQKKTEEANRLEAEREAARQKTREGYNKSFTAALQKHDLPATPYTVMRMADLMQENLRSGLDLSADEIAPLVREDLARETAAILEKMEIAQAVKALPKGFLDALRKYDLAQAKGGAERLTPKPPAPLGEVQRRPRRGEKITRQVDADAALEKWAEGR